MNAIALNRNSNEYLLLTSERNQKGINQI